MNIGDIITLPKEFLHNEIIYIYGLYDPADRIIRYVGKATHPFIRLHLHYSNAVKCKKQPKRCEHASQVEKWIFSLLQKKRLPELEVLDITSVAAWQDVERQWINKLQLQGNRLVNNDWKYKKEHKPDTVKKNKGKQECQTVRREKLRLLRDENEYTQSQLADMLGVNASTVSYWESGKRKIPKTIEIITDSYLL